MVARTIVLLALAAPSVAVERRWAHQLGHRWRALTSSTPAAASADRAVRVRRRFPVRGGVGRGPRPLEFRWLAAWSPGPRRSGRPDHRWREVVVPESRSRPRSRHAGCSRPGRRAAWYGGGHGAAASRDPSLRLHTADNIVVWTYGCLSLKGAFHGVERSIRANGDADVSWWGGAVAPDRCLGLAGRHRASGRNLFRDHARPPGGFRPRRRYRRVGRGRGRVE